MSRKHIRIFKFISLLMLVFSIPASLVFSHELNTSYTTILISSERFYLTEGFDLAQISERLSLDKNNDDILSRNELHEGLTLLYQYVEDDLEILLDDIPLKLIRKEERFDQEDLENLIPEEGFFLRAEAHEIIKLTWMQTHDGTADKLALKIGFLQEFGRNHKNLVRFMGKGETVIAILLPEDPATEFSLKEID